METINYVLKIFYKVIILKLIGRFINYNYNRIIL